MCIPLYINPEFIIKENIYICKKILSIADNFASDMGFNKKGVFEIMKIYKGTPVLFLEAITEYPGEYEILINSKYISVEKGLQHKLQISIAG